MESYLLSALCAAQVELFFSFSVSSAVILILKLVLNKNNTLIHNLIHEIRERCLDLVTSASVNVNVLVLFVSKSIVSCIKIKFCQLYFRLYQVLNISIIR